MSHIRFNKAFIFLAVFLTLLFVSGCSGKAEKYNEQGLEYYNSGDYDAAIGAFDEAISINGRNTEYYLNKGFALIAQGNYDAAADSINSALTLRPDSKYVLRAQGILYYYTEKYDEAILCFNRCLNMTENHVDDLGFDVVKYKAAAQIAAGYTKEAVDTYTKLIETQTDKTKYYYWRAMAYIKNQDEASAVEDFRNYINADGGYEAYLYAYNELVNSGYTDSAASLLTEALNNAGNKASDLKYRGIIYYIIGDYNNSITEFQKIEEDEKNAEVCIYEGMAFEAMGDLNNASDFYEQAVKKGGSDAVLFYDIALCNMNLGHYEEASYYTERGIQISGEDLKEKMMLLDIICKEYAHKYADAIESVKSYIEMFGSSDDMEHELAFLRTRTE